jgi:hypothetical protein
MGGDDLMGFRTLQPHHVHPLNGGLGQRQPPAPAYNTQSLERRPRRLPDIPSATANANVNTRSLPRPLKNGRGREDYRRREDEQRLEDEERKRRTHSLGEELQVGTDMYAQGSSKFSQPFNCTLDAQNLLSRRKLHNALNSYFA